MSSLFEELQCLSNSHAPADTFIQKCPQRAQDGHPRNSVLLKGGECSVRFCHVLLDSPTDSLQVIPDVASSSGREFSLGVQHRQQLPTTHLLGCEGTSVIRVAANHRVAHTIAPSNAADVIPNATAHALLSRPLAQPFAAGLQSVAHSINASRAVHFESIKCNLSVGGGLCDAVAERTEDATVLRALPMLGIQAGAEEEFQTKTRYASHGLNNTRNDPLLSRKGLTKEGMRLLSPILHDADRMPPDILDESALYNQNWSLHDMIQFNGILIDESEFTCLWVSQSTICNDTVKVKDIKTHLRRKHGVKCNLHSYKCFWNHCLEDRLMRHSSLERHIQERHTSVKWACPICDRTYTRRSTFLGHFKRCTRVSRPQDSVCGLGLGAT